MKTLKDRLSEFPFDMKAIKKNYGSKVEYLGILVHPNVNLKVYTFYQPKPNRELGHTEFFGLVYAHPNLFIIKLTGEELEAYAVRNAIKCTNCKDEIISLYRHDYQTCTCGECMIDGGGVYERYNKTEHAHHFRVNTLTKEVI